MDYRIARNANIILGICSVGLEAYAFHASFLVRNFEKAFLGVTSFYILEAIVFLIWFSNKPKQTWELAWRGFSAVILFGCAGLLIWSTVDIQDNICEFKELGACQHFELKLAAASVTFANGIFYLLATSPPAQANGQVWSYPKTAATAPFPQEPGHQAQYAQTVPQSGTVYVVPRAHLQPITNGSNYQPTASSTIVYTNSQSRPYQSVYPTLSSYQHSDASTLRNASAATTGGWVSSTRQGQIPSNFGY